MIKGELDSPPIPPDHPLLSELRQKRSTKPRSERGFTFLGPSRHAPVPHTPSASPVPAFSCAAVEGTGRNPMIRPRLRQNKTPATLRGFWTASNADGIRCWSSPVYYQDCELYQASTSLRT